METCDAEDLDNSKVSLKLYIDPHRTKNVDGRLGQWQARSLHVEGCLHDTHMPSPVQCHYLGITNVDNPFDQVKIQAY